MATVQERQNTTTSLKLPTYASLLVHVEAELSASHRVEVAVRLAREFGARLIGAAAEAIDYRYVYDSGPMMAELAKAADAQVSENLRQAEAAFERVAAGADHEWRSAHTDPRRFLLGAARAADLLIVGPAPRTPTPRSTHPADLVVAAGRPVLVVPPGAGNLQARKIVIAWKDTREARRAVADAMPFLVRAEDVIVQGVCGANDIDAVRFQTNDVAQALSRHGVAARAIVSEASEDQVAHEIDTVAGLNTADLIVAGAYGRSRLTEWVFGGVTDDLLHEPRRFVLFSH